MVLAKWEGVKEWRIRVVARPNICTLVMYSLITVKPTYVLHNAQHLTHGKPRHLLEKPGRRSWNASE